MTEPQHPVQRHIGRRSLLRGAAWSVPLVAVAVAAPAEAASGDLVTVTLTLGPRTDGVTWCLLTVGVVRNGSPVVGARVAIECRYNNDWVFYVRRRPLATAPTV